LTPRSSSSIEQSRAEQQQQQSSKQQAASKQQQVSRSVTESHLIQIKSHINRKAVAFVCLQGPLFLKFE